MKKGKDNEVSLLGRIIIFFRGIGDKIKKKRIFSSLIEKEKSLAVYEGPESSEESKLAYGFGVARVMAVILLVVLLVATLLFGSGTISYEKVYYMFKDIGYIKSYGESAPSALNYSMPVQNQDFEVFKNGLAVAGDSEIKLFTSTGRMTLTQGSEFTNPRMSASSEYLLIYDQGRRGYSVYNSFICVRTEKLDFPISYADMAENGSFLLVTSSKTYASVVKIFDSSLQEISEYSKNDKVISASLSSDGRYAAVLSLSADGGEAFTTLSVVDAYSSAVKYSVSFRGSMPYSCDFLTDDRIAVILDDKALVFDRAGNQKAEYSYPAEVVRFDVRGNRFALLLAEEAYGGKNTVVVFNKDGTPIFTETVDGTVRDMKLSGSAVYFLMSRETVRINTALRTVSRAETASDKATLIVFDDERIAVCTQTAARYISFD